MKCFAKKSRMLLLAVFFLSACGKSEDAPRSTSAAPAVPVAAVVSSGSNSAGAELGSVGSDGMPVLARKSNCTSCHAIGTKKLGPAWMDVAKKYKGATTYKLAGKEYPLEAGLIMKVSKGGAGVWGGMPMPPNAAVVKDEEIKMLVKFILGLAK